MARPSSICFGHSTCGLARHQDRADEALLVILDAVDAYLPGTVVATVAHLVPPAMVDHQPLPNLLVPGIVPGG